MLRIIVCLKLIIDPEVPFSVFKIDRESMRALPPEGMPPVINPFDENALEAALRIKDQNECKVTVLSMGRSLPKAILQRTLAVGADEVIALEGKEFDNLDAFGTARVLANAIKKVGEYDLIFTGRQAGDWDSGIVWAGIAEFLGIPVVTIARNAEIKDDKAVVERVVADGIEILEADLPLLVSFSNEVGELRKFSLPALMKVKKQDIPKWSASDVGFVPSEIMEMKDFYLPDLGETECIVIEGENPEQKGRNLARRLFEDGIIS